MQLCTRLMTFHGSHGTQLTDEVPKAYRRSRSGDKQHLTRSTLQKPRGVQSAMATSGAGHAGGDRSNFGCHNVASAQPTSKDQIANQQAGDVSTVKEFVMRRDLPCMICTAAVPARRQCEVAVPLPRRCHAIAGQQRHRLPWLGQQANWEDNYRHRST